MKRSDWVGASFSCFLSVLQNFPIHELQCHRGLQEADFLKLLRSTFPHLPANVSFDLLKLDRNRILHPLNVDSLTPEHIYRANKLARTTALFIRLKVQQSASGSVRLHVALWCKSASFF